MPLVRTFLDLNCGTTRCDIHGDHSPRIVCESVKGAGYEPRYNFIRFSLCFGDEQQIGLSKTLMLKYMDKATDLIHWQQSMRRFRMARKMVVDDAMNLEWVANRFPRMESQATLHNSPSVETMTANSEAYDSWAPLVEELSNLQQIIPAFAQRIAAARDAGTALHRQIEQSVLAGRDWEQELLIDRDIDGGEDFPF